MLMLNHISKWDPTHGWMPTTASEAHKDYPFGLTSHSGQYLCETCGQYVTLKISNKGTPFFWHPVGSRDCDDKLTLYGLYRNTNRLGFSLPLRIQVVPNAIEVLIGFLPLSLVDMEKAENNNVVLEISTGYGKILRNYAVTSERFSCEHITYLSVGSEISERYHLNLDDGNNYYWPRIIDGISGDGTLFDCLSGKRLPRNANVLVSNKYWLLTHKSLPYYMDVHVNLEKTIGNWKLYCVQAGLLSEKAANFFLKYGARLTDKPSEVTHIWPPTVRSSHFIIHCAEKIWFYKTDGYINMYPARKRYQYDSGFIAVTKIQFEQILSLSRFENYTSVLKYTLIRYVPQILRNEKRLQSISITDITDAHLESGEYETLPKKRLIYVDSEFDGFVKILQKGFEVERISFKGNEKTAIDVRFNQTYQIFQGLDCVAEILFKRSSNYNQHNNDAVFVLSLMQCSGHMVAVPHTFGVLAQQMQNMPETKRWLFKQLRSGTIRADAVKLLSKRLGRV